MSSMSSAQIVSATSVMHSKSTGLNLGLTYNPVPYPGAVSFATAASIYYDQAYILEPETVIVA